MTVSSWHQDVKPENVLVVSNGAKQPEEWQFKLADLGISHFKIKTNSREDSTASENYGTKTYGMSPDPTIKLYYTDRTSQVRRNAQGQTRARNHSNLE